MKEDGSPELVGIRDVDDILYGIRLRTRGSSRSRKEVRLVEDYICRQVNSTFSFHRFDRDREWSGLVGHSSY